jgi:hypothetical protein
MDRSNSDLVLIVIRVWRTEENTPIVGRVRVYEHAGERIVDSEFVGQTQLFEQMTAALRSTVLGNGTPGGQESITDDERRM